MPSRSRVRPSTPTEHSPSAVSSPSAGPSLRSHLFNILPKHALFKVKLHIRQISNVPLLGGEFAVKWRFRNVQSPSSNHNGLLSKMKANSSTMTIRGKMKDYFPDSQDSSITELGYSWMGNSTTGRNTPDSSSSPDCPSPVGTKSSSSSFSVISPNGTPSLAQVMPGTHSDSRGVTPWTELSDHTATWDHHVTLVVRMDVDRETFDLHASELKLTVLQKTIPGDQYQPQHPRLGAVYINLAEYVDVDVGSVTRRHLLRESKTNATLQLTIELEHVGGEGCYKAPPLQKGEILAQVTGLLANPGFHRARFLRELEFIEDPTKDPEGKYKTGKHVPSFDGLASSGGIRETEFLIETLFNPIPSKTLTPFTRDVEPPQITEQRSVESDRTSVELAPSLISTHSECSVGSSTRASDKSRPWWKGRASGNKSVASGVS